MVQQAEYQREELEEDIEQSRKECLERKKKLAENRSPTKGTV